MELRALRYFLAVAEELHFRRAANRVGVTQPSLSQQIARLETELDAALFTRSSRQVRLTPAGAAFLRGARRALIDAERAAHAARGAADGLSGELIIGALGSALNGVLPPLIRAFAAQSPGITLDVRQLDTAEQLAALQDHRLDIGFIRAAQPLPGIILATLAHEPLVAVLPDHHPSALWSTCRSPRSPKNPSSSGTARRHLATAPALPNPGRAPYNRRSHANVEPPLNRLARR
jgi:DNA-binding transcriptional LysR family regulator